MRIVARMSELAVGSRQLAEGGEFGVASALRGMPSNYRRLIAYRLAASLAGDTYRRVSAWPAFYRNTIGTQVVRSVGSIGANIAESSGRWHPREKRQFFVVARGSLYETEHWLAQARLCGLATPEAESLEELARTLNGLINKPTPR